VLGHVLSVAPKGYSGSIDLMVGISGGPEGTVQGVEIISHSETPGLGANADTPAFTGQYVGKTGSGFLNVVKIGPAGEDEIQAIASATITSQAVTDGVNTALSCYTAFQLGVEQ
jgi:electron transport complex protein RnfG